MVSIVHALSSRNEVFLEDTADLGYTVDLDDIVDLDNPSMVGISDYIPNLEILDSVVGDKVVSIVPN